MIIILTILGGILAVFAYSAYMQRRSEERLKSLLEASEAKFSVSQFRCVLIEAGPGACAHAQAYKQRPILLEAAPSLPLQSCTAKACDCKFIRLEDRRSGIDRRQLQEQSGKKANSYMNKRFIKDRRRKSIKEILVKPTPKFN